MTMRRRRIMMMRRRRRADGLSFDFKSFYGLEVRVFG